MDDYDYNAVYDAGYKQALVDMQKFIRYLEETEKRKGEKDENDED